MKHLLLIWALVYLPSKSVVGIYFSEKKCEIARIQTESVDYACVRGEEK